MFLRSVSRLMIVGGVIGICGAGLWWREFHSEVGRFLGSAELPIECLYTLGGACGLISDAASVVTSSADKPFFFWISAAVLLAGIILEGFPGGERNDVYLTRERDRDYLSAGPRRPSRSASIDAEGRLSAASRFDDRRGLTPLVLLALLAQNQAIRKRDGRERTATVA